jgi:Predicted signal transduction protein containing EAL and modified HD-GYP domains
LKKIRPLSKTIQQNILFLAEKIETYDEYKTYKGIGCTLFQGFFFSKPETIKGSSLNANTVVKQNFYPASIKMISHLRG